MTALLYYFGLLHAYWFLQTFGVEYTVMDFTTYDYLIRSADGLFVPLAVVASLALVALWSHPVLTVRIASQRREVIRKIASRIGLAAGGVLLIIAISGILEPYFWTAFTALPGLALSFGILTIRASIRTLQGIRRGNTGRIRRNKRSSHFQPTKIDGQLSQRSNFCEWASVFLLVNIGLFWAVANYSAAVGSGRGRDLVSALPYWPDVAIYSERDLSLPTSDTLETICGDSDSAYRYRYDGLKLILQSGSQYLFLPTSWAASRGAAIVLPKTDSIRLDFTKAALTHRGNC
ncbi:hypothetical protein [Amycolatopsis sp. NPDC051061]|uniref:hypothetical protein n=1 Tax=Amycolatopsis sp. NPDC051061 TaxID=3155042 RepID=UPI003431224B